jgi:hypothetical protein
MIHLLRVHGTGNTAHDIETNYVRDTQYYIPFTLHPAPLFSNF